MNGLYMRPVIISYNRAKALEYAHTWAMKRNPAYLDFEHLGGDCTNFASQVIYAGSGVMNYTPVYGWYYINGNKKTASWTGVNYLYKFLTANTGIGPFAETVDVRDIKPGDIIQLSFNNKDIFEHSPVVVETGNPATVNNILVAAHTYDRDYYPLTNYNWVGIRYIHIKGIRT